MDSLEAYSVIYYDERWRVSMTKEPIYIYVYICIYTLEAYSVIYYDEEAYIYVYIYMYIYVYILWRHIYMYIYFGGIFRHIL